MIACIFTIDYEIYGNGYGDLRELVFDPTERLLALFEKWNAKFVNFVEAAEFEKIEEYRTDAAVGDVRAQIRGIYEHGHEIALHLHPQWFNARHQQGRWLLDYADYNLCTLPPERITKLIGQSISYLREVVAVPDFTPVSFRAGNWLFQPTVNAAAALAQHGFKIDSSVFKGGWQTYHGLDYRRAPRNADFWQFGADVNEPDESGRLLEIPIYTKVVPFWRMVTGKRVGLQRKGGHTGRSGRQRLCRMLDLMRFTHPLKFDFCRMTIKELISMVDEVVRQDRESPGRFRPMVSIGHSKDLTDFETIEQFLAYLREQGIEIATLEQVYDHCRDALFGKPPGVSLPVR